MQNIGQVIAQKWVSKVWLVRAIFVHCNSVRNVLEWRASHHLVAHLWHKASHNGFHCRENVFLCGETHFKVGLVEFAWATVGT